VLGAWCLVLGAWFQRSEERQHQEPWQIRRFAFMDKVGGADYDWLVMTVDELQQVKDLVLRELPKVLQQDPGFVVFIEGLLSEKFPRRDEFARLLDEMEASRRENRERFDQVDQRLDRVEGEVKTLSGETGKRFDQVDQRFEQVDQRFEQVGQRFEQVDQRFDQVDRRFEQVDQRFDQVDQRFEQVDQRFGQVDQRFGQVDQRLGGIDGRLGAIDQRFERLENKLDQSVAELRDEIRGLKDWMELNVGGFQTKAGRRLEDVVAGAFRYGLRRSDIQPEQVKLRQKIVDTEGVVFRPGKTREVDLIALGEEILVFEVKATADADDIDDLADKVQLVRHLQSGKKVEGILVMLGAERGHRELCASYGLGLIP
jgi:archaellum component FlaC